YFSREVGGVLIVWSPALICSTRLVRRREGGKKDQLLFLSCRLLSNRSRPEVHRGRQRMAGASRRAAVPLARGSFGPLPPAPTCSPPVDFAIPPTTRKP